MQTPSGYSRRKLGIVILFLLGGSASFPTFAQDATSKDKQFLKFEAEGNTKIVEALKASEKKDHLRVDVSGDVQDDTLKVSSIKLL